MGFQVENLGSFHVRGICPFVHSWFLPRHPEANLRGRPPCSSPPRFVWSRPRASSCPHQTPGQSPAAAGNLSSQTTFDGRGQDLRLSCCPPLRVLLHYPRLMWSLGWSWGVDTPPLPASSTSRLHSPSLEKDSRWHFICHLLGHAKWTWVRSLAYLEVPPLDPIPRTLRGISVIF